MNKIKRIISMPSVTVAAFALSAVLLLTSGVGGARAALTYYSEVYSTRVAVSSIGVALNENGEAVSRRDYDGDGQWSQETGVLLSQMLKEDTSVKLGKAYPEELSVTNSGRIGQYVRVSVHRYWTENADNSTMDGEKNREISPAMIRLTLDGRDVGELARETGWLVDEDASTPERTVLYYSRMLAPGETTALFADTLTIDPEVASRVTQTEKTGADGKSKVITTTYDYDGFRFCVEAKVDAVQEHNARDAVYSAWGRSVSIGDGTLSLE